MKNQFKEDKSITNDTLRELLILKGLLDFYYSPDFDKKQVQSVIEQLYRETKYSENKAIAFHMLQIINQLQPGAPAPDFTAIDKIGNTVNLSNYKGKHIYLNFSQAKVKPVKKKCRK